jgi:hypothetical protein
MKKAYIKIHKKRLLHISIVLVLFLLIVIGSFYLCAIVESKAGLLLLLAIVFNAGWYLREYRDWIDKKYPKEKKCCGNCSSHYIDPYKVHRCSEKNMYKTYVDDLNYVCIYHKSKEKQDE